MERRPNMISHRQADYDDYLRESAPAVMLQFSRRTIPFTSQGMNTVLIELKRPEEPVTKEIIGVLTMHDWAKRTWQENGNLVSWNVSDLDRDEIIEHMTQLIEDFDDHGGTLRYWDATKISHDADGEFLKIEVSPR